jgi:hypothetical protein
MTKIKATASLKQRRTIDLTEVKDQLAGNE